MPQSYDGADVTIHFDGRRCIHARRCVTGAPGVFRAGVKGDWIDPDAESAEAVLRIAYACPSGAITVERKDGGAGEEAPRTNQVAVLENGPLAARAAMEVEGHGAVTRATLCRCGLSKNKPFCDNSHIEGGFVATGELPSKEMEMSIPDLVGPVTVTPHQDGPLQMKGALEVQTGTGRAVTRVKGAFFCRCGQSGNKPFCDGSHKAAGFKS
jgi:CDGSH-type Zn-finger protein/uncharacterized Fe-S cluster protein YjdI